MKLKAPFPWFGGKSRVAHVVWDRFGDCDNYVEPFAGSLAVLLGRPHRAQTETVNDIDCYLSNFWRALQADPDALEKHADWPVNEADLHARHLWLVNQEQFRESMKTDPDFYDARIAGWWVWGISQWIGSGWCSPTSALDRADGTPRRSRPCLTAQGVTRQIPQLSGDSTAQGRGIFTQEFSLSRKRPMIHGGHAGKGIHQDRRNPLLDYFYALADRLRRVRVCCGDWKRVTGPSVTVKHGVCGIFLDPPYDLRVVASNGEARGLYSTHSNDVSAEVRQWALENGDNPLLRIALCGYEGEHEVPGNWECVAWKATGGYGSQRGGEVNANAARERIWFSPHCPRPQESLFQESLRASTALSDRQPADKPAESTTAYQAKGA